MIIGLEWYGPAENYLINLAPRVQGLSPEYGGEYGYALALTQKKVRVLWDSGGVDDVDPRDIIFYADGGRSA